MMYKAFAAITLIAAPIIVLFVQYAVPQRPVQPVAVGTPAPQAVETAPQRLPPDQMAPSAPQPEAAQFGQPMPEAGKPFLTPGNGLPEIPSTQGEIGTEEVPAITDR